MRLLYSDDNGAICRTKDETQDIPDYAILSHTWLADNEEVSFSDLLGADLSNKAGFDKIKFCREQARKDQLSYFWVDTCCIDKSNHSELAEAIASMFRWYQNASHCYVYMSDVPTDSSSSHWVGSFRESRWFTRGWTLQELLAPRTVKFYSKEGHFLGDKRSLESVIHDITAIPVTALRGTALMEFSIEDRLSWAQKRNTTRKEDRAYCLQGIFGVFIPLIYGEEEHAFARLKKAIEEQYEVRDTESLDEGFRRMRRMKELNNLDMLDAYKFTVGDALSIIRFDQIDDRLANIAPCQDETCLWLVGSQAYLDWMDSSMVSQHLGFLWVKGKPGCGKSTLAKFMLGHLKNSSSSILLSFFFNARGTKLEKSINGLYRSLIAQILTMVAEPHKPWNVLFPSARALDEQLIHNPAKLKELLRQVLGLIKDLNLIIIIDALDEGDEDEVREMITYLEQLCTEAISASRTLRVLLLSRYYPHITLNSAIEVRVEDHQGHAEDIEKYISQHLRMADNKETRQLREIIQGKASGVFIWVVMVVHILNKAYDRGQVHNLHKKLEAIPDNLHDLFKDILTRDEESMDQTQLCIQWVLFSRRPLNQEELYFAILSGTEPDTLHEWDPQVITADIMRRFILSASKGLVEVTKTEDGTVQFIHESVRDFLKDGGLRDLMSCSQDQLQGLVHTKLKRSCLDYLQSDIFKRELDATLEESASSGDLHTSKTRSYPFLQYATRHVLSHAETSQACGQDQTEFLHDFPLKRWARLHNLVAKSDHGRYPPNINLLYILAEGNHSQLMQLIVRDQLHKREYGGNYGNPIFAAIASGSREAFQKLLAVEKETNPTGCLFPYRNLHPLLFLGSNASSELASQCLAFYHFRTDIHSNGLGSWLFMRMAAMGHEDGVLALIQRGMDVNIEGIGFHGSGLEAAAKNGRENMVQRLLDLGAHVNSPYANALSAAATNGHERIVLKLLAAGAVINSRMSDRGTALYAASSNGHARVVRILLAAGADATEKDATQETALQAACYGGHESVVEILLKQGVDIDIQGGKHGNALQTACYCGYPKIVRLLIDHGADVNSPGGPQGTAIQAAQSGAGYNPRGDHLKTVKILKEVGALWH